MEPFGRRWRAEREGVQEAALPRGRVVLSCSAPFATGGLGRHLQEISGAFDRAGSPASVLCGRTPSAAPPPARTELEAGPLARALDPLFRFSPAWSTWKAAVSFDRVAAANLPEGEHLLAFNGQALAQLRAARAAGYASLSLVSATPHMSHVARQHERAHRRYPLERPWAGRVLARNLAEYERAERILVSTEHIRASFLAEGFAEDRLSLFPLTPDPRFGPDPAASRSTTFDVVYVGSLSVAKGVPLLVDCVRRLSAPDLRLLLVGGWGSRGMRRFIEATCADDARIRVCRGDPLPYLHGARLCVHPSYDDGFGYAAAEAMATGLPVIVTEDTGMKELIDRGRNGLVVPTGDPDALGQAIEAAYRGEVLAD